MKHWLVVCWSVGFFGCTALTGFENLRFEEDGSPDSHRDGGPEHTCERDEECISLEPCIRYSCDPTSDDANDHGCVERRLTGDACEAGAACEVGFCDDGACQAQLDHSRCEGDILWGTKGYCSPGAPEADDKGCIELEDCFDVDDCELRLNDCMAAECDFDIYPFGVCFYSPAHCGHHDGCCPPGCNQTDDDDCALDCNRTSCDPYDEDGCCHETCLGKQGILDPDCCPFIDRCESGDGCCALGCEETDRDCGTYDD